MRPCARAASPLSCSTSGLPKLAGFEVLRKLRARDDRTPVLILTARDAVDDRVKGLDAGADDYVVKPIAIAELAARLRALVRRSQGGAGGVLRIGELEIDPAARTVRFAGVPVELQPREFAVLLELVAQRRPRADPRPARIAPVRVGRGAREQCDRGARPPPAAKSSRRR